MDGTEVGILKQPNEVGLGGLQEGQDNMALELQICLEALHDFTLWNSNL